MRVSEKQYKAMPAELQALFRRCPNPGSDEVVGLFPETNNKGHAPAKGKGNPFGGCNDTERQEYHFNDTGSAARFFYCAKASKKDRDEGCEGLDFQACGMMEDDNYDIKTGSGNSRDTKRRNTHPTVKPTNLLRYLCRLVTPPGGIILDPFMGSGSTGKAAMREGFRFIGIDLGSESCEIAAKRVDAEARQEGVALPACPWLP